MNKTDRFTIFVRAVIRGALFTAVFSTPVIALQPPTRSSPTPTPVYRPSTTKPINQPKPASSPTRTPVPKPPVYTWATAESLTSVTQVTDVKPTDSWYKALQILIEKYGIVGLTEGKKLNPNQILTPTAYRTIQQSARVQLQQIASRTGMLTRRFDELFPTNCPDPKVVADGLTSGEVVNSLKCIFGPTTLKAVYPDQPMTRGYFVQVFDDAVENGSSKIASNSRGETSPAKTSATPAELKALIDQGQRLMGSKDYDGAIRMFNQVIEYDANNIEAYRMRGISALLIYDQNPPMQGQKLYTALFNFDHAINRGSSNPDDYYLRGMTHVRMGSKEKAIADFRSALRMSPNHQGSKDELAKLGAVAPAAVASTSGLAGPISEDTLLGVWDVNAMANGVTNKGTFQIRRENGKLVVGWVRQTSKDEVLLNNVTVTADGSVAFKTGFSSYSFVGSLDAARNKLAGAFTLTSGNQKLTGTWEATRRGKL